MPQKMRYGQPKAGKADHSNMFDDPSLRGEELGPYEEDLFAAANDVRDERNTTGKPQQFAAAEAQEEAAPEPTVFQAPAEMQAEMESIKAQMEELRLRSAAEMENFKKRLQREHEEQMRFAAEKVLGDLLPTLDNLDLALQYGGNSEACKDMLQGVAMTHKLLLEAVMRHGLVPVGEEGEEFNPEIHEAVGFDSRPEIAANSVARVLQRGYKLANRLLRPAKVMVNH